MKHVAGRASRLPGDGPHPRDARGLSRGGAVQSGCVRLRGEQPWEDLEHTADVGLRVRGATAEEALGRLVLAFATLVTGGAPADPVREEVVSVEGGPGLAGTAVALLRELLFRLAAERLVPVEVEVRAADERGAVADVLFGRHDRERHAEGADVKAVTWHAARLEREGDGWVAQIVLDI